MEELPADFDLLWEERHPFAVLATVDGEGAPNAVWVSNLRRLDRRRVAIVDNALAKTRANLLAGRSASLLFTTRAGPAWELRGPVEYLREGPLVEEARRWGNPLYALVALAVLHVESARPV